MASQAVHREEIYPGGSRLSLIPIASANRKLVKLPLSSAEVAAACPASQDYLQKVHSW